MSHEEPTISRRAILTATAAAAASSVVQGFVGTATARPADGPASAAVFVRRAVGDLEVITLLDGRLSLPVGEVVKLVDGATIDAVAPLNEKARVPDSGLPLVVTAFLVRTGGKLVLIDTGSADKFQPPHFGEVPAAIKAAGDDPAEVDAILITHAHADHIAGLLDGEDRAQYPKAEVLISETEHRFWSDDDNMASVSEMQRPFFRLSQAALAPYKQRLTLFSGTREVLPGIVPVPLPGHTPGHTGFMLNSGKAQLLVWGDALHFAAWQFDHPEWKIRFDIDPDAGQASRTKALDMAAQDRLLVAGMHLPFPSFAHVERAGRGYRHISPL